MSCSAVCAECGEQLCPARMIRETIDRIHNEGEVAAVTRFVAGMLNECDMGKCLHLLAEASTLDAAEHDREMTLAVGTYMTLITLFDEYVGKTLSGKPMDEPQAAWFALRAGVRDKASFTAAIRVFSSDQVTSQIQNYVLGLIDDHRRILPLADTPEESAKAYDAYMAVVVRTLNILSSKAPHQMTMAVIGKDGDAQVVAGDGAPVPTVTVHKDTTKRSVH